MNKNVGADTTTSDTNMIFIKCKDCGSNFVFSAGEQVYFRNNGLKTPVRCKPCRNRNKANRNKYDGVIDAFVNKQNLYRGSVNTRYGRAGAISKKNFY